MEKIKVNIVTSYPVYWDNKKVMRDFIQNFYDAVGPEFFEECFSHTYEDETLTMRSNCSFDIKWLFYMGASSKRNGNRHCAGRFGEGFKIAALVAYRDLKLDITMMSRDWILHVAETAETIDGQAVSYLAYEVDERPYNEDAVLVLKGVDAELYAVFKTQIDSFYYKNNPRFGACIIQKQSYAIYYRRHIPDTHTGILMVNYQERGQLPFPVVICNHVYSLNHEDDRDREMLTTYDAV